MKARFTFFSTLSVTLCSRVGAAIRPQHLFYGPAMDPIAHTLIGATLAETRLRRTTALATPALLLGANAPDLDAITLFMTRDVSLGFRRGWTHGILAMVVLPLALAGLLMLLDRVRSRFRGPVRQNSPPLRPGALLAVCTIGVWSHPVLDWLNTYGVRLLMPFSGTWYYGDALFVVDPWVWLLAGTSVVLARSTSRAGLAAWVVLGVATTSLVTGFEGAPLATRLLWCAGVAGIVWLRATGRWRHALPRLATICVSAIAIYIIVMVAASRLAEEQVAAWLAEQGDDTPVEVMASPAPGNPFRRDIVVVGAEHYHFLELDWLRGAEPRVAARAIDRQPRGPRTDAIIAAARTAPHVQGLVTWIRYPAYAVEETADGYRVIITDMRYARRVSPLGASVVELDRDLKVKR